MGLDAEQGGGNSALPAPRGRQAEGPGAAGFAKGAGPLVQQGSPLLRFASIEHGTSMLGAPRLGRSRGQPTAVNSMDRMVHALGGAAQLPGHVGGALPARTGQQDLTPPQGKGIRGAEPGFQVLALLGGQWSKRDWWFHAP
jgi:hypothetical protein